MDSFSGLRIVITYPTIYRLIYNYDYKTKPHLIIGTFPLQCLPTPPTTLTSRRCRSPAAPCARTASAD